LPIELTDEYQAVLQSADTNPPAQSIEEVAAIIQEAKKPAAGETCKPGSDIFVGGGSMDLDEIDDAELDDIETSGDYVGAHEYF
jgi:serine/threonine-protein kinase SRK2